MGVNEQVASFASVEFYLAEIKLKSLILAQIERWRHALHMQVERQRGGNPGGERRTGEEYIGTYPGVGDNPAKVGLIPHMLYGGKPGILRRTWRYGSGRCPIS